MARSHLITCLSDACSPPRGWRASERVRVGSPLHCLLLLLPRSCTTLFTLPPQHISSRITHDILAIPFAPRVLVGRVMRACNPVHTLFTVQRCGALQLTQANSPFCLLLPHHVPVTLLLPSFVASAN